MSDFCDPMDFSTPGFPVHHQLPELAQTHVHWLVMPCNHLILYCPLLFLPLIFPSSVSFLLSWLFALGGQSIGASASASVLPMNIEGWFPLGLTDLISLKSEGLSNHLQHHSSKASILQCSASFMVQRSQPYMTTGKTIALTRWNFVGNVMSLLFNTLFRLVIAFLPRDKCLLILWLQSLSIVILETKKIKSATAPTFSLFAMK